MTDITTSTLPATSALTARFEPGALQARISACDVTIPAYKQLMQWAYETLNRAFREGADADFLVHGMARFVDVLLTHAWMHHMDEHADRMTLVAAGGYGRAELHPHSDIDLLILHHGRDLDASQRSLERFVTFLWDIGLEVGHSVRTPGECVKRARADITIMTNLLEARRLTGDEALFREMRLRIDKRKLWPVKRYFQAKLDEQDERYVKYRDTAYNLEPNVKESPGGLRDIHTIVWVAKRHFRAETLHELVDHGFLTEAEHAELLAGREFLWRVRFALHMLTGRREDRLVFDHQIQVAKLFGYNDESDNLAVEQFMQRYYRTIQVLSCLNDMLLQLFSEAIVHARDRVEPQPVNRRFRIRHGYIEAVSDRVFRRYPFALLEIFLIMQQREDVRGVRAETIRMIRRDRSLIDDKFRSDLRTRSLFMEILREPVGITHALRRMNRYGILGAYIPAFGRITGRMQYDLFHTLTVDEHILFVVRNMRRLNLPRFDHELPFCSKLAKTLPKPELLYLAGLFHDIAKGRGGDHSELGAIDATEFCMMHGLATWDSNLVSWLVSQHLLMSTTAQKRDISDPQVIHEFAEAVGDQLHLDYLFLLTVCDIRATNPNLWNSWRESLLNDLYLTTSRALERGLNNPLQQRELVVETQIEARALLRDAELSDGAIDRVWARFEEDYFLRNSAEEIAWQTRAIATTGEDDLPLIMVRNLADQGSTVFVYTSDVAYFFALSTGVLAQAGLNILEARISGTDDGYTLDTYIVIEDNGEAIADPEREAEIRRALVRAIRDPKTSHSNVSRRMARRLRYFSTPTQVHLNQDPANQRSVMELVAGDRPGLLSTVGDVFRRHGILVQAAKINTIGERAEDVFFITDANYQSIKDPALIQKLRSELTRALDEDSTD